MPVRENGPEGLVCWENEKISDNLFMEAPKGAGVSEVLGEDPRADKVVAGISQHPFRNGGDRDLQQAASCRRQRRNRS